MALMACKECKAEISTTAKTCPQCGGHNPAAYKSVRIGGLIYLGLIGLVFYWFWGLMSPEPKSTTAIPYTISKDELRDGRPRKVEVTLPRRLSDTELTEVAKAIRDNTELNADRTFIGFRVEGQTDSTYWANASFDPDYQSRVIGLSAADYQTLSELDLKGYPELVGSWLRDGALGHVMVLYKKGGKYFIDQLFAGGGKNTEAYRSKKLADGSLHLEDPDNGFHEYYLMKADGTLEGWGENGRYMSLLPRK